MNSEIILNITNMIVIFTKSECKNKYILLFVQVKFTILLSLKTIYK